MPSPSTIRTTRLALGLTQQQAEAQGRTNDRSRAAVVAFEAAVSEI